MNVLHFYHHIVRALQSLRLAPAKSDRTRAAPSVVKVDFQEFDPDHYKAIA